MFTCGSKIIRERLPIPIRPDQKELKFDYQLKEGKTIRFRFTDPNGCPLPNVMITSSFGKGDFWLANMMKNSDKEGCSFWNGAPDKPLVYSFCLAGFSSTEMTPYSVRNEEWNIVLHPTDKKEKSEKTEESTSDKTQISPRTASPYFQKQERNRTNRRHFLGMLLTV